MLNQKNTHRKNQQHTALGVGVLVILLILSWWQWGAVASTRDTLSFANQQLEQMRADSAQIQKLREAPQAAVSRARTNEELLAQIERSLASAGIDRNRWQDSIPQPPVRETGSPYIRHVTRIYLESIELKQLAGFVHRLEAEDATLSLSTVGLTARPNTAAYDAELGIAYLVFVPRTGRDDA